MTSPLFKTFVLKERWDGICGGWFVFSLESRPNVSNDLSLHLIGRGHGV